MSKMELTDSAQKLRRDMTIAERHLWYDFLKKQPYTVNRQKPFGDYILDYFIAQAKIAIEIDGIQHHSKGGEAYDKKRDAYLKEKGITVLRYDNAAVMERFDDVCEDIRKHVDSIIKEQHTEI